jgi:hypothetical protein
VFQTETRVVADVLSTLIMFTCAALPHRLLEWQKSKVVHAKAAKLNLNVDRRDRSDYFNYRNDGGTNASCCAAIGYKLLTSPGIPETYTFWMNTCNTPLESY